MGSKQKQTKQRQQQAFKQQIAARKKLLLENGLEQKNIKNDKVIQHLEAELRRTTRAIAAITATARLREKARYRKEERARKMVSEELESKKERTGSALAEHAKKQKKQKNLPTNHTEL